MLRYATPLAFASLGGLFSERSGVVNIGLEGMMLIGAFFAVWGSDVTGSWVLAILIAIGAGALMGLLYAVFAISLRSDQIVGGHGDQLPRTRDHQLFLLQALRIPGNAERPLDDSGRPPLVPRPRLHRRRLRTAQHHDLARDRLVFVTWIVVFKTPIGLRIRACGEHPRAADTVGIDVYKVRTPR
jgi:simple sugar transport system permease protein